MEHSSLFCFRWIRACHILRWMSNSHEPLNSRDETRFSLDEYLSLNNVNLAHNNQGFSSRAQSFFKSYIPEVVTFHNGVVQLFQKILVPIDGSEHSLKALEEAAQLAKISSGKITLINVCSVRSVLTDPSVSGHGPIPTSAQVSRMIEAVQKCGSKILQNGEQRISTTGIQVDKIQVEGHAVQEIARVANEGNFDLIVMGARGVSHIREMLLGSVTDGVLHHAHCAILVIK